MIYWKNKKVLVTGGDGFIGKTLVPTIEKLGGIVFIPRIEEYDLTKEIHVNKVFQKWDAEIVIHLAADVGGIAYLKSNPGKIFYNNVLMNTLVLEKAREYRTKKFIGISSINCYPEDAPIPLKESFIWVGKPENNVAAYGLSKRMMIYQSEAYRAQYSLNAINLILENTYGPFDNFDLQTSRVIPALIRKCIEAKEKNGKSIEVWGSGKQTRSFLYIDDAVRGILLATEKYDKQDPVNIGPDFEIKIGDLAYLIAELIGYEGDIIWNTSKPDGLMRRCLDVSLAEKEFGFKAKTNLKQGLKKTINWYLSKLHP